MLLLWHYHFDTFSTLPVERLHDNPNGPPGIWTMQRKTNVARGFKLKMEVKLESVYSPQVHVKPYVSTLFPIKVLLTIVPLVSAFEWFH